MGHTTVPSLLARWSSRCQLFHFDYSLASEDRGVKDEVKRCHQSESARQR